MRNRRKLILILCLLMLSGMTPQRGKITVYLIGDSTMADKRVSAFPETGWGTPFKTFFDSTVVIENHAQNGRSTRTFISENRWQQVYDQLEEGDYVFIQFGHNDEAKEKTERYTPPEQYKSNLRKFVLETKKRKANPVLLSPVTRRRFDDEGNIRETHAEYSPLVTEVARETSTPFIDMDKKSRDLLQKFGAENSRNLFLQLAPGEHPNYPDGKNDNTHFNELGARLMAQIVLAEILAQRLELADRVINRDKMKPQ
ncbi:MAG: rhamnogalacturonan acetylesterase [Bacteroidota bacterium]|nr:rhamnogalacturonan acetylesterase [Bacteroidota bacterium]